MYLLFLKLKDSENGVGFETRGVDIQSTSTSTRVQVQVHQRVSDPTEIRWQDRAFVLCQGDTYKGVPERIMAASRQVQWELSV